MLSSLLCLRIGASLHAKVNSESKSRLNARDSLIPFVVPCSLASRLSNVQQRRKSRHMLAWCRACSWDRARLSSSDTGRAPQSFAQADRYMMYWKTREACVLVEQRIQVVIVLNKQSRALARLKTAERRHHAGDTLLFHAYDEPSALLARISVESLWFFWNKMRCISTAEDLNHFSQIFLIEHAVFNTPAICRPTSVLPDLALYNRGIFPLSNHIRSSSVSDFRSPYWLETRKYLGDSMYPIIYINLDTKCPYC